ncbi:MAG: TetR/AcrR family transcriptional regulator [Tindallia sp. MSAO_Bac2]|nr:MAG: TetR/AcrR family transcriptional regulator [Tindallia sp. MSAO_Bac2]
MPKHFQEKEREIIYQRLIEEGKKHWQSYGIRRTNLEDLCKAVGISKGSFYSFFSSKELFFMEILEVSEKEMKESLMKALMNREGTGKERFIEAFTLAFKEAAQNPWLISFMTNPAEYEYLMRKLPQEAVQKHIDGDDEDVEKLLMSLGVDEKNVEIKTISAAIRGLFLLLLHEKELGEVPVEKVTKVLLEGLAERIFGRD